MEWHYSSGGKQQGPVDEQTLSDMIERGEVKPSALVWNPSLGTDWVKASTFPSLVPARKGKAQSKLGLAHQPEPEPPVSAVDILSQRIHGTPKKEYWLTPLKLYAILGGVLLLANVAFYQWALRVGNIPGNEFPGEAIVIPIIVTAVILFLTHMATGGRCAIGKGTHKVFSTIFFLVTVVVIFTGLRIFIGDEMDYSATTTVTIPASFVVTMIVRAIRREVGILAFADFLKP